jgi:hypothetical protein
VRVEGEGELGEDVDAFGGGHDVCCVVEVCTMDCLV